MNYLSKKYSTALWNKYYSGYVPVIPDIKTRSPAEGDLLQGRDPVKVAQAMERAGAPALSVVTEPVYYGGSPEVLRRIALATSLPILRKDFINSREQLLESVDLGASAVLLIVSMLEREQLFKLVENACQLGLEPLVETHSEAEINAAREIYLTMMGINNRNIMELEMDEGNVKTTENLAGLAGPEVLVISESSISSAKDIKRAHAAGAHAVLVGTFILRAPDSIELYRRMSEIRVISL